MPTPVPARASKMQSYVDTTEVDDIPDSYFNPRIPSSAIRRDTQGNQVIRRGNRQFVLHNEPPPKRKVHWTLILGIGMALMLGLWAGLIWASNWWTQHQLDATYGFPRTYQVDAVIYAGDTADHPSHYIFLNLNGTVQIIELPHGDSAHARIYKGPTIFSDQGALVPVTGEFKNVGGKVEMLIHIQNQLVVYVNDGTQFKPAQ